MKKNIKALALFSGGLDSALAVKVVKDQGIEVIGLNFVSHFFGGIGAGGRLRNTPFMLSIH